MLLCFGALRHRNRGKRDLHAPGNDKLYSRIHQGNFCTQAWMVVATGEWVFYLLDGSKVSRGCHKVLDALQHGHIALPRLQCLQRGTPARGRVWLGLDGLVRAGILHRGSRAQNLGKSSLESIVVLVVRHVQCAGTFVLVYPSPETSFALCRLSFPIFLS